VIEFLCPNGHKIHCPAEQGGRPAKCPRCGVKFLIPDRSEVDLAAVDSGISRPEFSDSAIPPPPPVVQSGGAEKGQTIEFLCPNGHRLHGPAELQGRPGECPDCGAKFRIPSYSDVLGDEDPKRPRPRPSTQPVQAKQMSQVPSGESLAKVLARLWEKRAKGAKVELHLANGEILVPDRYAEKLSGRSHGVFSVEETDGTHTLTMVAWDSVARLVVRGLKDLPGEMA